MSRQRSVSNRFGWASPFKNAPWAPGIWTWSLVVGLLASGATACRKSTVAPPLVVLRPPPPPPKVIVGELDAQNVLGDAPLRAVRAGAGPASVVASTIATEGERFGAFVQIPSEMCLVAYARGAPTIEDLDVAAFDDDGTPVGSDEGPDPRPAILLCPPHPERVYLLGRLSNGEGLVTLAAHLVSRDKAEEVGRVLAAHGGGREGTRPADAWPGIDDRVRPHRESLGGRWDEFRKVAVTVDPRAPTFVDFSMDPGQCTDAVAIPDDDVGPLELEAVDADGRLIARARNGSRTRSLTVCSPLPLRASLSLRPRAGRGLAAVVLARARGEVARDMQGHPDVAWAAPSAPLEKARAAYNEAMKKAGYSAPRKTTDGQLLIGRRFSMPVAFADHAGTCMRFDLVAGNPLAVVDASIWDESSALQGAATGVDTLSVFACGRGRGRLELDARGRPGPFSVVERTERWQSPEFSAHPLAASRMLARAVDGAWGTHEGNVHAVKSAALDATHNQVWEETLPPNRCLRVAVGAEGDGAGLWLRLFDGASADELDRSHGTYAVAVRGCAGPTAPRQVRIELRATSGVLTAVIGERISG